MAFYRSLAFKNAILYLIIFLTGLGIMGFLLLDNSSKRIIQTAENQLLHSGDLIDLQLKEYIDDLLSNLDFLSQNPVLIRHLEQSNDENYNLLANEFLTLIKSNSDFSQIRFLNADEGLEIVRVDQKNGACEIIDKPQLQNKRDRGYFKGSVLLNPSDIYFSPINLNREFGQISVPHTPTLRVARPIYFKNKLAGVIVINADLTKLFKKLQNSVSSNFTLRVINEDGYYLLHEEKDSTFVFEFGRTARQVESDLLANENKLIKQANELISIHKTEMKHMEYGLFYHIIANRAQLLKPYYEWRNKSILLILIIAFLFSGVAFLLLRQQSKNLMRLTNSMRQFPVNLKVSELPVARNDEIGDLARGFEDMAAIISDQMESIEMEKLKAEKAEKEKSNFIENISHEIRNPLQSITGLTHILEQNRPNANQIEILKSIKFNTNNLNALVNSILDYQNVIKGNVQAEWVWTDLPEQMKELTTGIKYAADQKSITIVKNVDAALEDIEIKMDQLRISQILNNLITNAITHTPSKGEIILAVDFIPETQDLGKVKFSVIDNGVGMSPTELSRIKERYFTKTKEKQLNSNFGLGLTIVHELLSLMDTQLVIESEKNSGSKFSFEIRTSKRTKIIHEKTVQHFDISGIDGNILIIDDDEQVLDLYKYFFKDLKAEFIPSFDALASRSEKTYDIIISDYLIGESTLVDHLRSLKMLTNDDTCLIVVSGVKPDLSVMAGTSTEIMFLQKPVDKLRLFKTISNARIFMKYGKPMVNNIKNDYDYDENKYKKAISLLLDEWKNYSEGLIQSISKKDLESFEALLHKFNNTLRRLQLAKFEDYLELVKSNIHQNDIDVEKESKEISRAMDLYFEFIASSMD